jgi:hypothetical protein
MEHCYPRQLLLDFGKCCPYHRIQATGKTKNYYMFLLALNIELKRKSLCRCKFTLYILSLNGICLLNTFFSTEYYLVFYLIHLSL